MTALAAPKVDPIEVVEKDEISGEAETKTHARFLTKEEWAEVVPPFYYIRVSFKEWGELEWDIVEKWILKNCTGWVYVAGRPKIIFGNEDDYVLFRMWAQAKPMQDTDTLEVK